AGLKEGSTTSEVSAGHTTAREAHPGPRGWRRMEILAPRMTPEGGRKPLQPAQQTSEEGREQTLKSRVVSREEEEEERVRLKRRSPSRAKALQRPKGQAQVTPVLWGRAKTTLRSGATPGQEERAWVAPQSRRRATSSLKSRSLPWQEEGALGKRQSWGRAKTAHRSRFPCSRASAVQPPCRVASLCFSLKEVPEEASASQGEQKPPEPPAPSPPPPGEPAKPVEEPDLVQEPAGEPPSLAGPEGERTLAETSPSAPESARDSAGPQIPTEAPCPAEQLPAENREDAATPGEVGAPPVEAPTSPYLTADFGKEDPSLILDDTPPPPAPFTHRIIKLRTGDFKDTYSINTKEMLGGGKFGEVRTCAVKETGLKLAVKMIKKQGPKDREMAEVEIDVMNQLNHRNLIQLYDAIETPREIMLFMEFVEGGELFERIIDEDYHLTEVDCMVFVRQICDGILFMHQMRVLHLDLKILTKDMFSLVLQPENILCVTATGHMVKIIDFGLARRFNPTQKLKVNFGTPEFLSPEVVSYEQVSYTTDMWSMGVIAYML
ncbi:hypothetical protein lerEdw1_004672, partial [Lerista edwardsae]